MTMKLVWSGMFQGAFKHQVLIEGAGDVYYLKRADFQLPVPPLPILEIGPEAIPDLREVYGIGPDGALYVLGQQDAETTVGERRVRTLASVSYGEADESWAPVDHELGNPFYGRMAVSPHGEILVVSNLPGFAIFDLDGNLKVDRAGLMREPGHFEVPADRPPFWHGGAGDVACGPDSFLVGGYPLARVDHYGYDGKLRHSLRSFTHDGKRYDFEAMSLAKVAFGPEGRMLVSTARELFVFTADGAIEHVVKAAEIDMGGGSADFHLWIAVDAQGRLWSQYYKGKEVAYGAFELPS